MKLLLLLTLPLYLLDQATKWLVLRFIGTDDTIPVIPGFFNLVQVHNTGAAFGMLKDNNLFFVILASVALGALIFLAKRGNFTDNPTRIGAVLLVSGILGNLTDRLLHGFVVDFLDVILPWYGHWPSFNVADSAICIAAFLFLISSFKSEKQKT
ncbi:signal peptidase II [bacterium]|nr:signal peptidase II [bacterium]